MRILPALPGHWMLATQGLGGGHRHRQSLALATLPVARSMVHASCLSCGCKAQQLRFCQKQLGRMLPQLQYHGFQLKQQQNAFPAVRTQPPMLYTSRLR